MPSVPSQENPAPGTAGTASGHLRRSSGRPKGADSAARREEILATAARVFSEEGYRGTSMSALARACGLSQTGLLHYFPTKDLLLGAVMEWRDAQDMALLEGLDRESPRGWSSVERLVQLVRLNTRQPGMIRLFTTLAGEATTHDHPANSWLLEHHRLAEEMILRSFREAAEDGQLRPDAPVESLVRCLVAAMDGLQLQWLSDPDYDGSAMADDFASLIQTIRERWAR
ncbi:TetR/AcrR family transcriptional regulator [Arthrobacter woluwensis]|uniref:TetR/AcrR family transcriptional regulator n=1 Tax=Arthrobacter woluwensis TaxID=156980 RepID=UPI001AAE9DD7|nr:TetR/AcrR family transcriptional regulator [Arthrobacter woluwensis]QTF73171.1 TetR/AcrR family transcriptional regulator [Arthrobacter woluwensis]